MNRQDYIDLYMSYMKPIKRKGKDDFIKWLLNDTDFVDCPAAARHHNNIEHGLIIHSLNVLNYARNLYLFSKKNYPDFPDIDAESLIISTLHHDLCKTNFYVKEASWVKHDYTWISYDSYKVSEGDFPFGHGEKSVVMMLRQGFDLTEQEMLAIRHHMGSFDGNSSTEKALKDPLVNLVHLADMCSCMVEKTVDYKELALSEHIQNLNK